MDPVTFLDMWTTGNANNTHWGDPKYDELIHQTAQTGNAKVRLDLLHRAEELFLSKAACGAGLLGNTRLFHATFGQELEPACT